MRILLLLSSGILWSVQVQSCLSFVLQKEKQPLAQHKEGTVEMNPGLNEWGRAPGDVLAPSPCSSCSFQTAGKSKKGQNQEQNQAEKWEFPLLFCPDTVCDCRVTPRPHPDPGEICLRSGSHCCISLISDHLLIALRSDLQVVLIKYLI